MHTCKDANWSVQLLLDAEAEGKGQRQDHQKERKCDDHLADHSVPQRFHFARDCLHLGPADTTEWQRSGDARGVQRRDIVAVGSGRKSDRPSIASLISPTKWPRMPENESEVGWAATTQRPTTPRHSTASTSPPPPMHLQRAE